MLCFSGAAFAALADCGDPSVQFLRSDRIAAKNMGFSEPSGLSLAPESGRFLSVSDDTSAVFLLDGNGPQKTLPEAVFDDEDLEGISLDVAGNRILAVSESARSIVVINTISGKTDRILLADMSGYAAVKTEFETSDHNDGLEGIAVDPTRDRIYLLKEKRPRLLVEVSTDLSSILGAQELTPVLGFVDNGQSDRHLDLSGLAIDAPTGCLWIVSDRGKRLFLFDPTGDSPTRSYALGWLDGKKARKLHHAEGVAHDARSDQLFIVNDDGKASRLFTFAIRRNTDGRQ